MSQKLLRDASLYRVLLEIDLELASQVQAAGCPCGGRLHGARYPRKPRGAQSLLPPGYRWRESFCCSRGDCRRRRTPASVRFLGRRVYLGAVVVLISALVHGPTPARLARLQRVVGVSESTIKRWRKWWLTTFRASAVWREAQARLIGLVSSALPASLLARFGAEEREGLVKCLRFLAPITTRSCLGWSPLFEGPRDPAQVGSSSPLNREA